MGFKREGMAIGHYFESQRPQVAPKTNADEFDLIKAGATVISFIWPAQNKALLDKLSGKKLMFWPWMPCRVFHALSPWMRLAP